MDEEEGGFLLESLGTIAPAGEDDELRHTPNSGDSPAQLSRQSRPRIEIDPNIELRKLRERQRRLEQRIFLFTVVLLAAVAGVVVATQTNFMSSTLDTLQQLSGAKSINCKVAANRSLPECSGNRPTSAEAWKGIERGTSSQFSLHGK